MSQSTSPARREATRPSALRSDTPRRVSFEQQRAEEEKSAGWSRLGEKEIEKAQKDVAQSARPQRMGSPSPSRGPSREARTVLVGQPAAPAGGSGREVGAGEPNVKGAEVTSAKKHKGDGEKGQKGKEGGKKGGGKPRPPWNQKKGEWTKKKGKGRGGKKGR